MFRGFRLVMGFIFLVRAPSVEIARCFIILLFRLMSLQKGHWLELSVTPWQNSNGFDTETFLGRDLVLGSLGVFVVFWGRYLWISYLFHNHWLYFTVCESVAVLVSSQISLYSWYSDSGAYTPYARNTEQQKRTTESQSQK